MTRSSADVVAEAIDRIGGPAQAIIPDPHPEMNPNVLASWEVELDGYLAEYQDSLLEGSAATFSKAAPLLDIIRWATEHGYKLHINITKTGA